MIDVGHKIPREEREAAFKRKVKELVGGEYTIIGQYQYNNRKVLTRHEVCGREFSMTPKSFTSGNHRCPHCGRERTAKKNSRNHKSTHEEYEKKLQNRQGKGTFTLLSKYKSSQEKIKFRHNCEACSNHEGWIIAGQLMQKGCPSMKHKKKRYEGGWIIYCELPLISQKIKGGHEEFSSKLKKLPHGTNIELLGRYVKATNKMKARCLVCGSVQTVYPQQLLKNGFCNTCSYKRRNQEKIIPLEEMLKRIDEYYGEDSYEVVNPGDYVDSLTHTLFRHMECGHEWQATMVNVTRGFGCPKCNPHSKGEQWLEQIFIENNVNFQKEVTFPDLKDKRALRYDFGVLDESHNLKILIEYNGLQHYKKVGFFDKRRSLEARRESDRKKYLYARDKNIPLGIIPHHYDSKEKIARILEKNNIIKGVDANA